MKLGKRLAFEGVSLGSKISIFFSAIIMITFFIIESMVIFGAIKHDNEIWIHYFAYVCILLFIPPFIFVVVEFLRNKAKVIKELQQKNTYLEHAAKIIRHDMHSGINTYLPRGVRALERKLSPEQIEEFKIESPIKMIREGLKHTQKVYKGVYEFTNLVKKDAEMSMELLNIKDMLSDYLSSTSYKSQVVLDSTLDYKIKVNESLFCTAIDNLIRNGIKYNDSDTKYVKIYREGKTIVIEDNGRGMSREDFDYLSQPYTRKDGQKETGTGLGLNICKSIIDEHKFTFRVEKIEGDISDFYKQLNNIEERYTKNPDTYSFNKESIEKVAKENQYMGKIGFRRGGRDKSKVYVYYDTTKDSNRGTKIKIITK